MAVDGITATYIAANQFSVVGNQTVDFHGGRRVKAALTGGNVYSTISGSVFGAVTTVTLFDSELDNTLTTVWYGIGIGSVGSLPDHAHDSSEGSGGELTISGAGGDYLARDGSTPLTGDWNFGSQTISGTGDIWCNDLHTAGASLYIGDVQLTSASNVLDFGTNTISGTGDMAAGRLGLGNVVDLAEQDSKFWVITEDVGWGAFYKYSDDTGGSAPSMYKARGTYAVPAAVQASDVVGGYNAFAHDGTQHDQIGKLRHLVESIGAGNVRSYIEFHVSDASGVLQEMARINSTGMILGDGVDQQADYPLHVLDSNAVISLDGDGSSAVAGIVFDKQNNTQWYMYNDGANADTFILESDSVNMYSIAIGRTYGDIGIGYKGPNLPNSSTRLSIIADESSGVGVLTVAQYSDDGSGAAFSGYKSRGADQSNPTAAQADDVITGYNAFAHDGTVFDNVGRIRHRVESINLGDIASYIEFYTSSISGIAREVVRVHSTGDLEIYEGALILANYGSIGVPGRIDVMTVSSGIVEFDGHIRATLSGAYDIGTSDYPFRDIYLTGGSVYLNAEKISSPSSGIIDFNNATLINATISGGGTTEHSALNELDYASAGHTDFVSTNTTQTITGLKTFSQDVTINADLTAVSGTFDYVEITDSISEIQFTSASGVIGVAGDEDLLLLSAEQLTIQGTNASQIVFSTSSGTIGVSTNEDILTLTSGIVYFDGDIRATVSGVYDIGTSDFPFRDIYCNDLYTVGSTVHIGDTVELSEVSSDVNINTDLRLSQQHPSIIGAGSYSNPTVNIQMPQPSKNFGAFNLRDYTDTTFFTVTDNQGGNYSNIGHTGRTFNAYLASSAAYTFERSSANDWTFKFNDGSGATKFNWEDNTNTVVAHVDSDGNVDSHGNVTVSGYVGWDSVQLSEYNNIDLAISSDIRFSHADPTISSNYGAGAGHLIVKLASAPSKSNQTFKINDGNDTTMFGVVANDGEIQARGNLSWEFAGSDAAIEADTGYDLSIRMGDDTAGNYLNFTDSGDNIVAWIDSDGNSDFLGNVTTSGSWQSSNFNTPGLNVFVGATAGANTTVDGKRNTAVGNQALATNTDGDVNVAIGYRTMGFTGGGDFNYNTAVGGYAGYAITIGGNNVFLGATSGRSITTTSGNVFLGYAAGRDETGSNKLYIENSESALPLIYGEFDNDLVRINGDFDVTGDVVVSGTIYSEDILFGANTISGTGDIYCNDIFTSSGTVYIGSEQISSSSPGLLDFGSSNLQSAGHMAIGNNADIDFPGFPTYEILCNMQENFDASIVGAYGLQLYARGAADSGSATVRGISASAVHDSGGQFNTVRAVYGAAYTGDYDAVGNNLQGIYGSAYIAQNNATVTNIIGGYFTAGSVSSIVTATGTNVVAGQFRALATGSGDFNVDETFGVQIKTPGASFNGTLNYLYGLYIEDMTASSMTFTNEYNIYSAGATSQNYFEGDIYFDGTISGTDGIFTGPVSGITPSLDPHFTTKGYVDDAIEQVVYTPISVDLVAGTYDGGTVSGTQGLSDGESYDVREVAATPGYDIRFTCSGVVSFNRFWAHIFYDGSVLHTANLELWNYDTVGWDTITSFNGGQTGYTWFEMPILADEDYIQDTVTQVRLYHTSPGNVSHYVYIDYIAVAKAGFGSAGSDHGAATGLLDDDHPQYLLANGTRALTGDWNFGSQTISGTGDIYCNDIFTSSGTVYIGSEQISSPSPGVLDFGGAEIQNATVSGGGGAVTFLGHSDTPVNYTDQAGKAVVVKGTEDGLEFATVSGIGGSIWTQTGSDIYYNDGNVAIGDTAASGTLHVHSASAGSIPPHANADDLIIENSDNAGISIHTPDANYGVIYFGSPSENNYAEIFCSYDTPTLAVGTNVAGGTISFRTDIQAQRMFIDSSGGVYINDSANTDMTIGLTINQADNDDQILAFKSSDIAHGITDRAETDTYASFNKASFDFGGLSITGFAESTDALALKGFSTTENTSFGTTQTPFTYVQTALKSGTGIQAPSATALIFGVRAYNGSTWPFSWQVNRQGDTWQAGSIFVNDTSNADMTIGLTINQGANDDQIFALKSSDIAHGITGIAETDTYFYAKKLNADSGGAALVGLSEINLGLIFGGILTTDDTTKTTSSHGAIILDGAKKSGTGTTSIGTDGNIVAMKNNWSTRWILNAEGKTWQYAGADFGGNVMINAEGSGSGILQLKGGTTSKGGIINVFESDDSGGNLTLMADGTAIMLVGKDGTVFINETANTGMTVGLTINQAANDNEALALKSSDVSHPVTGLAEADTYFMAKKQSATNGGVSLFGITDDDIQPFVLHGVFGTTDPLDARGAVEVRGYKSDGGTSTTLLADTETVFNIRNNTLISAAFYGDGSAYIAKDLNVIGDISCNDIFTASGTVYIGDEQISSPSPGVIDFGGATFNNANIPGTSGGNWVLADSTTHSGSALNWTVSDLDGDAYEWLLIEGDVDASGVNDGIDFQFNGDTGSNYERSRHWFGNTHSFSDTSGTFITLIDWGSGGCTGKFRIYVGLRTGTIRTVRSEGNRKDKSSGNQYGMHYSGHWNNTSSNVTSITFLSSLALTTKLKVYRWTAGAADYTKGRQELITEYATTSGIDILPGRIDIEDGSSQYALQVSGTLFKDSLSLSADTWYYVYAKPPVSGNYLSESEIELSTTEPGRDVAKRGYYHGSNTDWRCFGAFYSTSVSEVAPFMQVGNRWILDDSDNYMGNDVNGASNSTFTTVTCNTPFGDTFILGQSRLFYSNASAHVKWRRYGSSAAGFRLNYVDSDGGADNYMDITLPVDSQKRGEWKWNTATTNLFYLVNMGYILPDWIAPK